MAAADRGARELALSVLLDVFCKGAYSNLRLKEELDRSRAKGEDRALCTELVYGVLRTFGVLDHYIEGLSTVKRKKLSPHIIIILRLSLYQLIFLERIPPSAACNEGVRLARRYGHGGSAGFVNAILRNFLRKRDTGGLSPLPPGDKAAALSVRYSLPLWIIETWEKSYGRERMLKLCERSALRPSDTVIRVNTLKTDVASLEERLKSEGAVTRPVPGLKSALFLQCSGSPASLSAFDEGLFWMQSIPSQTAAGAVMAAPHSFVIDMCAAPGGKSFYMAADMENKGKILCLELHVHRAALIEKNARRLGIDITHPKMGDASLFDPALENSADAVLCDVPCSGLGTIVRKPDIRLKNPPGPELLELSKSILKNAARYVKKGGILLYSTCTLNSAENEKVAGAFLSEEEGRFALLPPILPETGDVRDSEGMVTIFPGEGCDEGFFICRMVRKE